MRGQCDKSGGWSKFVVQGCNWPRQPVFPHSSRPCYRAHMLCPSCGQQNPSGHSHCAACHRALPGHAFPAEGSGSGNAPQPAPAVPPRILTRPAPLKPPPIDVVPAALPPQAYPANLAASPPLGSQTVTAPHSMHRPPRLPRGPVGTHASSSPPLPTRKVPSPAAPRAPRVAPAPSMGMEMDSSPTPPLPSLAETTTTLHVAPAWRAAAAFLIDALLFFLFASAIGVGLARIWDLRFAWQPWVDFMHGDVVRDAGIVAMVCVAPGIFLQGVSVFFWGATPGQRLFRLRVIRADNGQKPSLLRSLLRGVGSSMGTLFFAASPLWAFWLDRRRRGFGDVLAQAVVVRAEIGAAAKEDAP